MSKKKANKAIKKGVSKKKASGSKSLKKVVKKSPAPKKKATKKPSKPAKKAAVKKVIAKKKVAKPALSKKKVVKKVQPKKAVAKKPAKVAPKKVVVKKSAKVAPKKAPKPVVVKKAVSKPAAKIAVTKAVVSEKNLKPVFPSVKKVETPIVVPQKFAPEPKGRFELEYTIHTSTAILYEFLTTSSGLSEWFCDDVNSRNGIYSFQWDGSVQNAKLVKAEDERLARFQWIDKNDGTYFEFRIERDDLTNDISLIVVDFADSADERVSTTLLWDSQIEKLLSVLGSH